MDLYRQAREKYQPQKVKLLLITEAPPPHDRHRYFYFDRVLRGDSLFLETIKVLFAEEVAAFETTKQIRAEKIYFLERLQEEGFFLIHAADTPLPGKTTAARTQVYREQLPALMKNILTIASPTTPIVLVSAVVFRAIGEPLRASGFNVIHDEPIAYPNSGQQLNFRKKIKPLLLQQQLIPSL